MKKIVKISNLIPHPKNYRVHTKEQIEKIKKSIEKFGIVKNIVISEDNYILAGHGVVEALKQLGIEEVEAYILPVKHDDNVAKALLIADNEIQKQAIDDLVMLYDTLQTLDTELLYSTGYDEELLRLLQYQISDIRYNPDELLELKEDIKGDEWKVIFNFLSKEDREKFLNEITDVIEEFKLKRYENVDVINKLTISYSQRQRKKRKEND